MEATPVRVLLIEDNPDDAVLMRAELACVKGAQFHVETVGRLSAGLERLGRGGIDALLLDLSLPDSSGADTFHAVHGRMPRLPIVVLTGLDDEDVALELMKEGAQDYLVKGQVEGSLLARSIRYAIERSRAREALQASNRRLKLLSDAAGQLLVTDDPRDLLEGLYARLSSLLDLELYFHYTASPTGDGLELMAYAGVPEQRIGPMKYLKPGQWVCGTVAAICAPLVIEDVQRSTDPMTEFIRSLGITAYACHPLIAGDRLIGTLSFGTRKHPRFDPEALALMRTVSDQIAVAIERKRVEQAVDEERKRLELMLETSPVGILVADAKGSVLLCNMEAKRIFGVLDGEGTHIDHFRERLVFLRSDGRPYEIEELPLNRALTGQRVWAAEVRIERHDGASILSVVNSAPIYGASGGVIGGISVVQDISALEETERLRSEFLGIVSHEMRTPLAAIKGAAVTALTSRRPLDIAEVSENFQIIDEQADRLRDLVDNLLDITRIDAGTLSISPEPLDLLSVVSEAQTTFSRSVGHAHELRVSVPDRLPPVRADRRRVIQVLINLLTNAAKFSKPGDVIEVKVRHDPIYVTISVQDYGLGIAHERLNRIFEKFSRSHDRSARNPVGTGLGLAISRGIVEAHGGRIWAESEGEGEGATFSFTLPVAIEAEDAAPSPGGVIRPRTSAVRTRIVAVDDEQRVLRILQRVLEEAGYHPIVTTDPSQVIDLVEIERPDLMVMDIKFPGVSGLDLLDRVRRVSNVPIIFLTASDEEGHMVSALQRGADDYIRKPFSSSELLARIEAVLRRRSLEAQSEMKPPFELHDLVIDFSRRRATLKGKELSLSATEYKLLCELAMNAGRLLTHDQILERVWGEEYSGGETESLRTFIRSLRRQLGDQANQPRYIITERGMGYMMPTPRKP